MIKEKEKIKLISTHKNNVIKYGMRLVNWLSDQYSANDAQDLLYRLYLHDNSKFLFPEWNYIFDPEKKELFEWAVSSHRRRNDHHPEWWAGGIKDLLKYRLIAMELAVDWYARSIENKEDIFKWIEEKAIPRFNINTKSKEYKEFVQYIRILARKPK